LAKRIDPDALEPIKATLYPPPFDKRCRNRERKKLGDAVNLTQFGINLLRLPPNTWSSQRHWHTHSDEFVYVLSGEVVLVTDEGPEILRAGDAAGFKANDPNGHCLQNRTGSDAIVLEVGTRSEGDAVTYPDIDMVSPSSQKPAIYMHRDGAPYEDIKRRGPETPEEKAV